MAHQAARQGESGAPTLIRVKRSRQEARLDTIVVNESGVEAHPLESRRKKFRQNLDQVENELATASLEPGVRSSPFVPPENSSALHSPETQSASLFRPKVFRRVASVPARTLRSRDGAQRVMAHIRSGLKDATKSNFINGSRRADTVRSHRDAARQESRLRMLEQRRALPGPESKSNANDSDAFSELAHVLDAVFHTGRPTPSTEKLPSNDHMSMLEEHLSQQQPSDDKDDAEDMVDLFAEIEPEADFTLDSLDPRATALCVPLRSTWHTHRSSCVYYVV